MAPGDRIWIYFATPVKEVGAVAEVVGEEWSARLSTPRIERRRKSYENWWVPGGAWHGVNDQPEPAVFSPTCC